MIDLKLQYGISDCLLSFRKLTDATVGDVIVGFWQVSVAGKKLLCIEKVKGDGTADTDTEADKEEECGRHRAWTISVYRLIITGVGGRFIP